MSDRARPWLVFFFSPRCGRCRRVEAFIAQALQHRHNHNTFALYNIANDQRPDLVGRFKIDTLPTLLVIENKRVRARLEAPRTSHQIQEFLSPWLQGQPGAVTAA